MLLKICGSKKVFFCLVNSILFSLKIVNSSYFNFTSGDTCGNFTGKLVIRLSHWTVECIFFFHFYKEFLDKHCSDCMVKSVTVSNCKNDINFLMRFFVVFSMNDSFYEGHEFKFPTKSKNVNTILIRIGLLSILGLP